MDFKELYLACWAHTHQNSHVEDGELGEASSLQSLHGFQRLNLSHQACTANTILTELYHQS